MPINSSSEFGSYKDPTDNVTPPLSLGSSTTGSFAQQTAWRTPRSRTSVPLSYSKRTAGSTFKFDDDSPTPSVTRPKE